MVDIKCFFDYTLSRLLLFADGYEGRDGWVINYIKKSKE